MAWQGAPYYQDPGQPGYPPNIGFQPTSGYPPQGGYPQSDPNQGYGQPGYPPTAGGYPAGGYPAGGYPQAGGAGYPPGGYPPQGAPYQPGFIPPSQPGYNQAGGGYGGANYDPEAADDEIKGFAFSDQTIRRAFIRKVYMILMVQLSITFGFVALFVFHKPTKLWAWRHPELFWVAFVVMLVTMISMACCESVRRKSPTNLIFLGLFTLAESFMLAVTSARFDAIEVLMAVGITAAVCLGLTIFALQTKWDFTVMGAVLFVCLIVFFLFGLIAIFFHSKILSLVYSSIGALLFSFYLIYDTQLMLGGKHKYSISPEEYIFAALNLYIDIIQIFMYILSIISASRD